MEARIAHLMAADNGILSRAEINAALAVDVSQNKHKYKNGPNSWADEPCVFLDVLEDPVQRHQLGRQNCRYCHTYCAYLPQDR